MQLKVKGIMSYPTLFTPRKITEDSAPKYSVTILVAENDPQIAQIQKAFDDTKASAFPSGFPTNGKCAFRKSETTPGYYEIRCNAGEESKPQVVDAQLQPIVDPSQVYAGAVAWFSINVYSYDQPMSKGVTAGVNGVMVTGEEGELGRIDGRPTVEQMFSGVPVGAAPAPTPAAPPAAPTPPAPAYQMTEKANGMTKEQYNAAGWTDTQLVENGMMALPGGVTPSFV